MRESSTFVGLDVHKERIFAAMLVPGAEVARMWEMPHTSQELGRLSRRLLRESGGDVLCCYEAGPCGFAPQRELQRHGVRCLVIAPSLVPVKPGERVKTDRRDARKLAINLRAGSLTEVHPPTPEEEAVRGLCRCREDARHDLMRCRHRMNKLLLRCGIVFREGRAWTVKHRQWLRRIVFDHAAAQATFDDYLLAIEQLEERVKGIEAKLAELAEQEPYRTPVGWLRCLRGLETISAITIVAELFDFRRFLSPRDLMAYLGVVPSEHSSFPQQRRGAITKAGNTHVRRLLIEAAWHYQHRPGVGAALARRRRGQPAWVIALADRAQVRLHRRYVRLAYGRGKEKNKAIVAVARELVGFIWAILSPQLEQTRQTV
jgi:transposase